VPALTWGRAYERASLGVDALAGITVAAYLVPQCMAYAGVAGLPAVAGLWAIVPSLCAYAAFGPSRLLSVGPESTTALMTAAALAPLSVTDLDRYAALAALLALLVAACCAVAWVARLGFVAGLLSRPVLIGYTAGVAVIMIVGQLERLTDVPVEGDRVPQETWSFLRHLGDAEAATVAVSASVVLLLFAVRWRWPTAPGPLIAVVVASIAVAVLDLADRGVDTVGTVATGRPDVGLPDVSWSDVRSLLLAAVGIAIVGFSDNVLTSRAFASGDEQIEANQELLALAAANVGAGLVHGFPVSSSGSRTAIAASMRSRSQVYSVVAALAVVVVLVAGRGALARFPDAALGGIVVFAAVRLVDVGELRRLARFRSSELWLAIATTVGVLVFDILYGVLLALGLSVVELLTRVARPHDAILGHVPGLAGMHDIDDYPEAVEVPGLVVYRYDAPLFFANADDFRARALDSVDSRPFDVRWFVLNVEANVEVDLTALDAVEALRRELARRGVVFALARVKQDLLAQLCAAGLAARIGENLMFPTLPTALEAYRRWEEANRPRPGDNDGTVVPD
jgi:high affinity sulfate transporter 1